MEKNVDKNKDSKDKNQKVQVVSLCEDGNVHEHDQASYEKMLKHQKENKSNK